MISKTTNIHLLSLADTEAVQILVSDAAIAATTRVPHPYPENGAREFISSHFKDRADEKAYVFAIKDHQQLVGLCGVHGIEAGNAHELGFWIGRPFWGKGYASLGVGMVMQFAFEDLRLERIGSAALESNAPSRRVLEKNGFRLLGVFNHQDPLLKRPDELLATYEITRREWQLHCGTKISAQTQT